MTYEETLNIPLCELLDLISIEQIKAEGFKYQRPMSQQDQLMSLLGVM